MADLNWQAVGEGAEGIVISQSREAVVVDRGDEVFVQLGLDGEIVQEIVCSSLDRAKNVGEGWVLYNSEDGWS